jgi:hypothetical protein
MGPHIGRYVLAPALVGYGTLYVLVRRAGSTATKRRTTLPGDRLIPTPTW